MHTYVSNLSCSYVTRLYKPGSGGEVQVKLSAVCISTIYDIARLIDAVSDPFVEVVGNVEEANMIKILANTDLGSDFSKRILLLLTLDNKLVTWHTKTKKRTATRRPRKQKRKGSTRGQIQGGEGTRFLVLDSGWGSL